MPYQANVSQPKHIPGLIAAGYNLTMTKLNFWLFPGRQAPPPKQIRVCEVGTPWEQANSGNSGRGQRTYVTAGYS